MTTVVAPAFLRRLAAHRVTGSQVPGSSPEKPSRTGWAFCIFRAALRLVATSVPKLVALVSVSLIKCTFDFQKVINVVAEATSGGHPYFNTSSGAVNEV